MTKTSEHAMSAIQAMVKAEVRRETALLRRKLAKMRMQRDQWRARANELREKRQVAEASLQATIRRSATTTADPGVPRTSWR